MIVNVPFIIRSSQDPPGVSVLHKAPVKLPAPEQYLLAPSQARVERNSVEMQFSPLAGKQEAFDFPHCLSESRVPVPGTRLN
jgi:hypothetical protein